MVLKPASGKYVKKSLKYSILDGAFYASMVGFGESFFSAFAVFLRATSTQLGLLGSLPQTIGALLQLFSSKLLMHFKSRKSLSVVFSSLQALMYLFVALVFFFGELKVWLLILFVCLYWAFSTLITPAWSSWMGDLVSEKSRGEYFGRRNKIAGFVTFATFTAGGYLLQEFADGTTTQYLGFVVLFFLALVSRIISTVYLSRQYEPDYVVDKKLQFSFWQFLKEARFHNYGLFVIYLGFMNLAVYIASPFFTPYMLEHLGFDYATFTIVTATALVVKFITMPIWGKLSDKYGTKKVLAASGFLMPIVPILWIFSHDVLYLIAIQAYSGFAWAGFEVASFNFIFDSTSREKRATCVAYYNVVVGLLIFVGAMLGSALLKFIPDVTGYFVVFLVSYVARSLTSIFFLPHLRERREVSRISYRKLVFKAVSMLPTAGMVSHLVTFGRDEVVKLEHAVMHKSRKKAKK
jgi:MFS family permease